MKKALLVIVCAALLFIMTACRNGEVSIPTYNVSPTDTAAGTLPTGLPGETPTDGTVSPQSPTTNPTEPSGENIQQSDSTIPQQNTEPSEPTETDENNVTNSTTQNSVITETPQNTTTPSTEQEESVIAETQSAVQADKGTDQPSLPIGNLVPPTLEPHNPAPENNYALWWPCEHCGKMIET